VSRPLRLLAPADTDPSELAALLTRLRGRTNTVHVGVDPAPAAVQVPLVLGGAARSETGEDTARPLGPHPALVEALARQADGALDGRETATALLVGPGGDDHDANAEIAKVARLLQEGRTFAGVEHAYLADSSPTITEGLHRCQLLGATEVVVLPYSLLEPAFAAAVLDAVITHPTALPAVTTTGLGDSPELAEVIWERYHEVLHGDLRTGCDVCTHRAPKVGCQG